MEEITFVNTMFHDTHFMTCLLMRVSAHHLGRVRIMMRPCNARFGQNGFLAVNVLSLKPVLQSCVFDTQYIY